MDLLDQPAATGEPAAEPARPAPTVRVVHLPEKRRFVIEVGGRRAGFTEYFEAEDRRVFVHTEIGQPFSGRGLASALVRAALTETRTEGRRLVAMCPYVSRWVTSHPGFDDVVVQSAR